MDKIIRAAVNRYSDFAKGAYEYNDLLQMAYEEFYKSKYDPGRGALSTFIYLTTMRVLTHEFQHAKEYEYLETEPITKNGYNELPSLLKDIFPKLYIDEYYVIKKIFYEDWPLKKVAEKMDLSVGRVSQIKKEALNKLATMFKIRGINEKNYRDYITYN